MLDVEKAKELLHSQELSRRDQLLVLLVIGGREPKTVAKLKSLAVEAGLKKAANWNVSHILSVKPPVALRVPGGWEASPGGLQRLASLGVSARSPAIQNVAVELRSHLEGLADEDSKRFLSEATACYETGSYRAAVVLSWVGAVWVLQDFVFRNHLAAFNAEALKRDAKFRAVKSIDDFGRVKEHDFLQILAAISVLGKNVKQQLEERLTLRNGCGHPNSLTIGANTVAAHIELLLANVFTKFR